MKLLVTGGAGFIGSNFIRYILDNNKVIAVGLIFIGLLVFNL